MILNLTQHTSTQDQKDAGIIDLKGQQLSKLKDLLTFDTIPNKQEMMDRAHDIALLSDFNGIGLDDDDPFFLDVMIGGAPFFMGYLEAALKAAHKKPCYAFSKRVVEEFKGDKETVEKKVIFKHVGFVKAE